MTTIVCIADLHEHLVDVDVASIEGLEEPGVERPRAFLALKSWGIADKIHIVGVVVDIALAVCGIGECLVGGRCRRMDELAYFLGVHGVTVGRRQRTGKGGPQRAPERPRGKVGANLGGGRVYCV